MPSLTRTSWFGPAQRTLRRLRGSEHSIRRPEAKDVVAAAPTYFVLGLLLFWSIDGGGFDRLTWYRGTLVLLALATGSYLATSRRAALSREVQLAVLAFAAFAIWSFVSVSWAGVKSDALDAANRTLLYALVFWFFVSRDWTLAAAKRHLYVLACGVAILGFVTVEQVLHASDPMTSLLYSRLAEPTGYPNATAALFLLPAWPMVLLAARREGSIFGRALAGSTACALLCLSLIPQSRGAVFVLPVIALLVLVSMPSPLRQAVALVIPGVAAYAIHARLLDVFSAASRDGDVVGALTSARNAILIAAGATALAFAVWAGLDRRLELSAAFVRRTNLVAASFVALLVVGGLVGIGVAGHPQRWSERAWRDFKYGGEPQGSSRFASLGSQRYDFWRVSLDVFASYPVGGIGAGNFEAPYAQHRRSNEEPTNPHSLELQILLGTGIVGAGIMVAFLLLSLRMLRRHPGQERIARGIALAAAISFAYFLLNASVDWLWEFPAIAGAAFALLGLGLRLASPGTDADRRLCPPRVRMVCAGLVALAACSAAVVLILPMLGESKTRQAIYSWRTDPAGALRLLREARSLDFLNDEPDIVAGVIATKAGKPQTAEAVFADATRRDPQDWYAWLRLAAASSGLGKHAQAAASVDRAAELDPREPLIREVRREIKAGKAVSGARIDQLMADQVNQLLG